jgi:hypothetical protein
MLLGIIARYVPGIKCITYCNYRKYRYNKAVLELMTLFNSNSLMSFKKKQMIYLYEQSTPFGCRSLMKLSNQDKAREILKNMIAEKELLED